MYLLGQFVLLSGMLLSRKICLFGATCSKFLTYVFCHNKIKIKVYFHDFAEHFSLIFKFFVYPSEVFRNSLFNK